MYVNPFWFGVCATIGAEAIALIAIALWMGGRRR